MSKSVKSPQEVLTKFRKYCYYIEKEKAEKYKKERNKQNKTQAKSNNRKESEKLFFDKNIKYCLGRDNFYDGVYAEFLKWQFKNVKGKTFSQFLMAEIERKGLKPKDFYKKADISRKLFSDIKRKENYKPKKDTVIKSCLALELNEDEFNSVLNECGYALSSNEQKDLFIQYCFKKGIYQIDVVNNVLFLLDLPILGEK